MPPARLIAVALLVGPLALALACCALSDTAVAPQPASVSVTGAIPNAGGKGTVASAGVLGSGIGAGLDERDRQRAYDAELKALEQGEPGEPVGWRGAAGRYGTVVPGASYETRGTRCRDYSHTIFMDGKPQTARATACRNPDGTWAPAS